MKKSPINTPAFFLVVLSIFCLYAYSNNDRRPSSKALPSPGSFSGPETQAKPRVPAKKTQPDVKKKPAIPPVADPKPADKEDISDGERLIAKSDCMGCHKLQTKLIGPAYTDVARKYASGKANVQLLIDKIIKESTRV